MPFPAMMPNSVSSPRTVLIAAVLCRTNKAHSSVGAVAYGSKVSMGQRRDIGASFRHHAEYLPTAISRLDVSDTHFQVSLTTTTTKADRSRNPG
jgi:hypothetical protein